MVKPTEQIRLDVRSSLAEYHEITLEFLRKRITDTELEQRKERIINRIMKQLEKDADMTQKIIMTRERNEK